MKYPYIGKVEAEGGSSILIKSSKSVGYIIKNNLDDALEGLWESGYCGDSHIKNITTEYLANTYGEVKSKEHAEFIIKLAENEGCAGLVLAKRKIFNIESLNGVFFNFYTENGVLWLAFLREIQAKNRGEKQITIPLPPECEERKPKEVIANGRKHTLNSVTGFYDFSVVDLGYVSGSTLEKLQEADDYQVISFVGDDASLDDEWPKVGDTVSLRYRFDSKQIMYTGELLYLSSNHIIIKTENGNDCHCIRSEWDIEKPKTPEQELAEKLIEKYKHLGKKEQAIAIAQDIVQNAIDKYNITKKPQ